MQTKYVYLVQFEHVQPQLLDSLHDTTAFAIVLIFTARINLNTFPFGSCVCVCVCVCVNVGVQESRCKSTSYLRSLRFILSSFKIIYSRAFY